MKLFDRRRKHPQGVNLIVFNQLDKYEFGECENCGNEIEPDWGLFNKKLENSPYPDWCPKCGRFFDRLIKAEDVK